MSRNHSTELEPLVSGFEHLSDKPRGSEALERLRRIASIVKPLMRQRNWVVGTLAEFYPTEANLLGLNINRGQKICVRLRYPGDERQFLPLENVVDTMLHELAHIVIGPHNRDFHALWDKLRDEHEALVRKGYTGEGFLGRGNRLGGGSRGRVPVSEVKRQARAAAERRHKAAALSAGSGQKLGGSGIMRGQDARAVIAAAAEKRIKIERGCATSSTDRGRQIARDEAAKNAKVVRTTADREDEDEAALMQAYIELIQEDEKAQLGDLYVAPSQSNPAGSKGVSGGAGSRAQSQASTSSKPPGNDGSSLVQQQLELEQSIKQQKEKQQQQQNRPPTPPPTTWTCDICTLINPLQFLICDACGTERPALYSHSPPRPAHTSSNRTKERTSESRKNNNSNNNQTHASLGLHTRQNALESIRKFDQQEAYKKSLPVGWQCHGCGNWMETQWWTCSVCGQMKASS